MPPGQPTKYRPEYAVQAYKLCLLKATEPEMADIFGVAIDTITEWKNRHPTFSAAIKRGRGYADANVASRLYERAMGYEAPAVKIFMPPGATEPVYAHYTEHHPPDTNAASLWLRNRQSGKWREKIEHEHSSKRDLSEYTREELLALAGVIEHAAEAPSAQSSETGADIKSLPKP